VRGRSLYFDRRMLAIALMGFASGLPLLLTTSTLGYWLSKVGIDKTTIGLFALVGLPYALKFLWAPVLDRATIPVLGAALGRRRSWALAAQLALVGAIVGLGASDPLDAPALTAAWALAVSFLSATQDVAIDAYRIEVLDDDEQGAGAAVTQAGYRGGMLAAGAGAVALADFLPWSVVFAALAVAVGVGMLGVLLGPEPERPPGLAPPVPEEGALRRALLVPFRELSRHPQWGAILLFALLYKYGDAVAGVMANPFYVDLGFSGVEVASVTKVWSIVAFLPGVFVGGVLVAKLGVLRGLFVGGVLQALTNLLFALLAVRGHDLAFLAVAVGSDAFTGGLASAAFVAFLSNLSRGAATGTQYALLTSLMAAGRTAMSSGSGWLADQVGWPGFWVATTLLAVPGLLLLWWLAARGAPLSEEPGSGRRA
jgi:PAT family beta-lactamase induction signal transducer AmpG